MLTRKLDTLLSERETPNLWSRDRSQIVCELCHKVGHPKNRCHKLKECHTCHRVGHISKFCRTPTTATKREENPIPKSGIYLALHVL